MKLKKAFIFLGLFFLMTLNTKLNAQSTFEFAIVDYTPSYKFIEVSINGDEYKKINVEKSEIKGEGDASVALKVVNKMVNEEGWELFNTNTVGGSTLAYKSYVFYLRRKK